MASECYHTVKHVIQETAGAGGSLWNHDGSGLMWLWLWLVSYIRTSVPPEGHCSPAPVLQSSGRQRAVILGLWTSLLLLHPSRENTALLWGLTKPLLMMLFHTEVGGPKACCVSGAFPHAAALCGSRGGLGGTS